VGATEKATDDESTWRALRIINTAESPVKRGALLVDDDPLGSWQRIGEHLMSKDRSIALRIDAELEDRLKEAAKNDRRPFAQFVRNVLEDAVAKPQVRPA
jgi:hypothetical protein